MDYFQTLSTGITFNGDDAVLYMESCPTHWDKEVRIKITNACTKNTVVLFQGSFRVEECRSIAQMLNATVAYRDLCDKMDEQKKDGK